MPHTSPAPLAWTLPSAYVLAFVSAVVPWVNAEVVMLSAVSLAGSSDEVAALVAAVTAGQMTGKSLMYWLAKRSSATRLPRMERALAEWRRRLERGPGRALTTVFVSALVGFPPFYLVSIAAGALDVAFVRFLAVGTLGRLLHFGAVALAPSLAGFRL